MKKILLSLFGCSLVFSGCTQMVTLPIHATGAVVGTTIDVAGSAAHAIAGDNDESR